MGCAENRDRRALGGIMNRITNRYLVAIALMLSLTIDNGCPGDSTQPSESSTSRAVSTAKIHYYYDPLGRLVQATATDGTGVHYAYDQVGNITAVRRLNAGVLGVVDFVPRTGAVGTAVTI
jgi:YD repeat-containing protein